MSTTQSNTTATPMDTGPGLTHQTPRSLPPVPPSSLPISMIAGSSALPLPGASELGSILSLGGGMSGGGTGGSTMAGGASSRGVSLSGATMGTGDVTKGSTAGIKFAKPKAGLNVSLSQPHCAG